jgi:hypothetical protein
MVNPEIVPKLWPNQRPVLPLPENHNAVRSVITNSRLRDCLLQQSILSGNNLFQYRHSCIFSNSRYFPITQLALRLLGSWEKLDQAVNQLSDVFNQSSKLLLLVQCPLCLLTYTILALTRNSQLPHLVVKLRHC